MIPNGGPAFPRYEPSGGNRFEGPMPEIRYSGMSLRDWFAGQALCGLCAADILSQVSMQAAAYQLADAMLAERAKEKS